MRPTFEQYATLQTSVDITTNMQVIPAGSDVEVEAYWDELTGTSWMYSDGNLAAMVYAMRSTHLPLDDDVIYVKYQGLGSLVHVSELAFPDPN